ncbi:MAG: pyruvate kinase alpha/beta domain-containing protein [Thermoplasmata archaeon]
MRVFPNPGPQNTDECLELAAMRTRELGVGEVVVATNSGGTALKALQHFPGARIIAVNHHAGFKEPFKVEMPDDARRKLEAAGAVVIVAAHALSGIERSFRAKYQGLYPMELVADTLRMFGQGTKVCVEIALMAADAGELSGKPVMCIGGSGTGADTAIVLTPVHQRNFLDMRIHEIVCKPN